MKGMVMNGQLKENNWKEKGILRENAFIYKEEM